MKNEEKNLDSYLKQLAGDKSRLLVDEGKGTSFALETSVEDIEDGGVLVRVREQADATDLSADLSTINSNVNNIYPGVILRADSNLMDGTPNVLDSPKLIRKPIKVWLDINGNTQDAVWVNEPDQPSIINAVNKQVDNWLAQGRKISANLTYKSVLVNDSQQVKVGLGITGADKLFDLDINACQKGEKKEMLVIFEQIYYTAKVKPQRASELYDEKVTCEDLADAGLNEKETKAAALVTGVNFGRMIVVKLSTEDVSGSIEATWKASIKATGFNNTDEYKKAMKNTSFSVFVYGGTAGGAKLVIDSTGDISKVNEAIEHDLEFTSESAVRPISYTSNYIDDETQAVVTRATKYTNVKLIKRKGIRFSTDSANAYATKHQILYGRPIKSGGADGKLKLGGWEKLMDEAGGNQQRSISGKYVEFGFEFDIVWGTDWPYSNVFWNQNNGVAEDIFIEWGGTVRKAWLKIKVNNALVVNDTNCSSHSRYNFGV